MRVQLTWHGNGLCQACGAPLDKRQPDVVQLLGVEPQPLYFIPVCSACMEIDPPHAHSHPMSSSLPAPNTPKR